MIYIFFYCLISVCAQDKDTSSIFKPNQICIGLSVSTNLDYEPFEITKFHQKFDHDFIYDANLIGLGYYDILMPTLSLSLFPNKKWCHSIDIRYSKHTDDLEERDRHDTWGNYNFNHTNITYGLDYLLINKDSNNNISVYPFVGINSLFSIFNYYMDYSGHYGSGEVWYFNTEDRNIFNYSLQPCFGLQLNSRRIHAEVALNFNILGIYYEKYITESTTNYDYSSEGGVQYSTISYKDDSNSSFLFIGDYNDSSLLFHSLSFKIAYNL